MRFCVRCGRALPKEELIRGYCRDCFKQQVQILSGVPEVKLVVCPRCGSWLHKGDWNPPSTEVEALETALSSEVRKHIIDGAELIAARVVGIEHNNNALKLEAELDIAIEGKVLTFSYTLQARREYKVCARCSAKAAGRYSYLIQVRFAGDAPESVINEVRSEVLEVAGDAIVDVKVTRGGIDVELDDSAAARRVVETIAKRRAARVSSSFKSTKFNARSGKWLGITTYSIRIPVFRRGEVTIYRNRVCFVVGTQQGRRIVVWLPDTNTYEIVDADSYWSEELKRPVRVEFEDLLVERVENSTVVVREANTGATRSIKLGGRSIALKGGERVLLVRADNLETLVPREKVVT